MYTLWQILFLILEISLVSTVDTEGKKKEQKVCKTKYCREIAEAIKKSRNTAADPCQNFYEYACGSWNKYKPIPSYKVVSSRAAMLQESIYSEMKELLTEKINVNDIPSTVTMKLLYSSCLNSKADKTADISNILKILDQTGGWPAAMPFKSWNPNAKPWQKIDNYYFKFIGRSVFYEIDYESDLTKQQEVVISIRPTSDIPWTSKIHFVDKRSAPPSYQNAMSHVISLIAQKSGYTLDKNRLAKDVNDMVNFENALLTLLSQQYQRWGVITAKELSSKKYAKPDIFQSLKSAYQTVGITFDPTETFMMYNYEFFDNLRDYLGTVPARTIVNYIQWNMVFLLLTFSTTELWKLKFNTLYSEFKLKNYPPRWLSCIHDLNFQDATSYMFIARNVQNNTLQSAGTMAQKVRIEVKSLVSNSKGLTNDMKAFMLQKIAGIHIELGYPKWYRNQMNIVREYNDLQIGKDYFLNALVYKRFEYKRFLKLYRGGLEKLTWRIQPTRINAYYSGRINTVAVPGSHMQPPALTPFLPNAFNYGTIGVILGHELSHSVTTNSIWFDEDMNLKSWPENDLYSYKMREQCFLNQYKNLSFPVKDSHGKDIQLNGKTILDENLADNIGIKASYLAFKKLASYRDADMKLPGLESLTEDQLFFLSFAHNGCQSIRPEYEQYVYKNDIHGPQKFRTMSSLANMPEFAAAFKCPPGSPMNPQTKCNLL